MTKAIILGIEDGGKAPTFDAALAFPESLLARARALANDEARRAGCTIADGVRGLRSAYTIDRSKLGDIARTKHRYVGGAFFLVRDLPKAMSIAFELGARGLLPAKKAARVLDLGAGFGTTSFGYARASRALGAHDSLLVDAVDSDGGVLERMTRLVPPEGDEELTPISLRTHAGSLEDFLARARGPYDVVLVGLALNELADDEARRLALVERALELLSADGVLIIIEPALHQTSRALMSLRDRIAAAGHALAAPCTRSLPCPMLSAGDRDWCHLELDLPLPPEEAAISALAGMRDEKLTFSPLVISRRAQEPSENARIVSRPLGSKGKTEVVACAGVGLVRLRQLDRDEGALRLHQLRRGSLVTPEPALRSTEALRVGRDVTILPVFR